MGIRFDHAEWERYVPAAHDNRAGDEPCVCEIRPMTVAELRVFQAAQARVLGKKQPSAQALKALQDTMGEILTERVRKIERCYIARPIETGADLAAHGTEELILDVFEAIVKQSHLEEGLEKKYVGSSGLSPPETQP